MKIYRPLWSEGVLLSPQQFQQQTEWESFRSAGISALASPFPWGVEKVELNDSLLSSGLIQITQLRLWLEDGTLIDAQRSDLPPVPRELDAGQLADHDAVTVVIALPHMQPGVINVEQEGVSADRPVRYREEWVTLQDAFGSEEEPMAVARFNFTIRFAHENNDSWKVCPVARLIRLHFLNQYPITTSKLGSSRYARLIKLAYSASVAATAVELDRLYSTNAQIFTREIL